jgi:quercetin dioxygenase-like cupin family protein
MRGLSLVVLATIGISSGAYAQTSEMILPDSIVFKAPFRPGGPAGAVLYGDPTKKGLYVTRVKFAAGQKNMPHWHPDERTVVVLSGTYYFAYGEQWDESKLRALPPGSFLTEPPKSPHFNWAKDGEVILQITGYGPTDATAILQKQ